MWRDGHVYDRAAAGVAHRELVGRLAHRQRAVDVQTLHSLPALGREAFGRHHVLAAGVVEHQVEAPMAFKRLRHDPLGAGPLTDVTRYPRAPLTDLARGRLEDLASPARDHHRSAAAYELSCRRLAEVGAATGDDRDPLLERAVDEDARGPHPYSPSTLITSRFGRPPSNSQ
jgi:hypothetical protein